jgi:hypothetical protein
LNGTGSDPFADDFYFCWFKWSEIFGHFGFAIDGSDLTDHRASVDIPWNNGGVARFTTFEEAGEVGHQVTALGFGGLMAGEAVCPEDGQNVFGPSWVCWVGREGLGG